MSDKDLVKNYIPEDVKTIHLIAICGTGMAALAGMLKDKGFTVSGSDRTDVSGLSQSSPASQAS